MKNWLIGSIGVVLVILIILGIRFFSEESQNKAKRYFGNQMGYKHGRVDILAGQGKPVMTFLQVEKLTSATASQGDGDRSYRYGYGYFDMNLNSKVDLNEKKMGKRYFDVNDFTMAVFRDMGFTDFVKPQAKL